MTLRLPSDLSGIGALSSDAGRLYPPRGFMAFADHALGNGDSFGLYWPIGLETEDPLVCETVHDEQGIVPAFSSLGAFVRIAGELEEDDPPEWPSIESDKLSPYACLTAARDAVGVGDVVRACALLQHAIYRLPEYTGALALLSMQSLRAGNHDDACRFAVRAVRSPPSFAGGVDIRKVWNWLSRQTRGPDSIASDPIWLRRLSMAAPPMGGTQQNDLYISLAEAADDYVSRGDFDSALALEQAYGEFMRRETVSFQERYGFDLSRHLERQRDLEMRRPQGLRELTR